jgi:hypothetical protein
MSDPTRYYVDFRYHGVALDWWTPTTYPTTDITALCIAACDSLAARTDPDAWTFRVFEAECVTTPISGRGVMKQYLKGMEI